MAKFARSRRQRHDDTGTGIIDVVVASGLLALMVAVLASLLANVASAQLTVATRRYATTLADDVLGTAIAAGCGTASGYGTAAQAKSLAQNCTWGANDVQSLGDVVTSGPTGTTVACPASVGAGVPGPACYSAPGFSVPIEVGLGFSWAWDHAGPSCASLATGGPVASPPDEVVATVEVLWGDPKVQGEYFSVSRTKLAAPPGVLSTAWAAGGLGAVVVLTTSPAPVGLVVPSWAGTAPSVVSETTYDGTGTCAVFAYVPAGAGYQVWAGQPSNVSASFNVSAGQWAVQDLSA